MNKYRADIGYREAIHKVQIEKETEASIWIDGRRRGKSSEYSSYFDTWDQAHAYLIKKADGNLHRAKVSLALAQKAYNKTKEMSNSRA